MSRFILLVLSVLTLVLGACAPAVQGSMVTNAINLDEEDAVVTPGATWFVQNSIPANAFDLDLERKWSLTGVSEGQRIRTRVGKEVNIFQVGLPEDWNFRLQTSTGIQEIENVSRSNDYINVEWQEFVQLTFVVDIPANTQGGTYRGAVSVTANGKMQIIPVEISVEGLEPGVGAAETGIES
jgi:hypothetical protein